MASLNELLDSVGKEIGGCAGNKGRRLQPEFIENAEKTMKPVAGLVLAARHLPNIRRTIWARPISSQDLVLKVDEESHPRITRPEMLVEMELLPGILDLVRIDHAPTMPRDTISGTIGSPTDRDKGSCPYGPFSTSRSESLPHSEKLPT